VFAGAVRDSAHTETSMKAKTRAKADKAGLALGSLAPLEIKESD